MVSRLFRFLRRHAWSVSLTAGAALSFLELADEIREGELAPVDAAVADWITSLRGSADGLMLKLTELGGFGGMLSLCAGAALALVAAKKRKQALFMLSCGTGAIVLNALLKLVFQRARPDATSIYEIQALSSFSFPSGHAMGSTGVVGGLAIVAWTLLRHRAWRIGTSTAALTFIAGVAASRVYFGVHYPSDVMGGCLAGAAWVAAMTGWFYPRLLPGEEATTAPPVR
jgi:undecaprenyl-diphosphatase